MAGSNTKAGGGAKSKASNGKAAAPQAPLKPAAQIASAAEKYVAKKTVAAKPEPKPEPKPAPKAEAKPEPKSAPKPAAKAEPKAKGPVVAFGPGWKQEVQGELVAGGTVTIQYDPARAPANHVQNGAPAWGVQAFVKLVPSGQVIEQPVVDFEGSKTAKARPATVELTRGTTEIQVWFKNWTGGDNQREQWDSNFGNNYRFSVRG